MVRPAGEGASCPSKIKKESTMAIVMVGATDVARSWRPLILRGRPVAQIKALFELYPAVAAEVRFSTAAAFDWRENPRGS